MESVPDNEDNQTEAAKEEEAAKASIQSKASEVISHGSTTAILDDLE